jgi:hypothetical protein
MKSLHAGLLMVGATLAGALAFKMTKQPLIPDPPPLARLNPQVIPAQPKIEKTKPSPLVAPPEKIIVAKAVAQPVETAPAAVYTQPAVLKSAPVERPKPPAAKLVSPKLSPPKLIAKATPPAKVPPTQWIPTKYQAAPTEVPQPDPVPTPATEPAVPEPAQPPPAPEPPPAPRRVTLQTGMTIAARLDETISSSGATPGDAFQASLSEPLAVDGLVIAERGARVVGRVVDSERGIISLALASVYTSDGQRVGLLTDRWTHQSEPSFFFRRSATVPTGTVIHFRISNRVTVTEQQIATR